MPRISIFFGITVYMYYDDHSPPHFHAAYEGLEGVFSFDGNLIRGFLSPKAQALVREWCSLHAKELEGNWIRAQEGSSLHWIDPLR